MVNGVRSPSEQSPHYNDSFPVIHVYFKKTMNVLFTFGTAKTNTELVANAHLLLPWLSHYLDLK